MGETKNDFSQKYDMILNSDRIFYIPEQTVSSETDKAIFVVFERADESPDSQTLLHNIMKATDTVYQIKTQKIAVESHKGALAYPLITDKHPKKILVFGISLKSLGLHLEVPKYTPVTINTIVLLRADSLSLINTDKSLKVKLWKALQTMFDVVKK